MQDSEDLVSRILSGKVTVRKIGSARVAEGSDPAAVVQAVENARSAQRLSAEAKQSSLENRLEEAIHTLRQSIAIEESIGNLAGIASDLGNIAYYYFRLKKWNEAEAIYKMVRGLDEHLLSLEELSDFKTRDYQTMRGMHDEGLARVLIATGRRQAALPLIDEALSAYTTAQSRELVDAASELKTWLLKKLNP